MEFVPLTFDLKDLGIITFDKAILSGLFESFNEQTKRLILTSPPDISCKRTITIKFQFKLINQKTNQIILLLNRK